MVDICGYEYFPHVENPWIPYLTLILGACIIQYVFWYLFIPVKTFYIDGDEISEALDGEELGILTSILELKNGSEKK